MSLGNMEYEHLSTPMTSSTSVASEEDEEDSHSRLCLIRHNAHAVKARVVLSASGVRIEAEDACLSEIRYNVQLPLSNMIGVDVIEDAERPDSEKERNVIDDDTNAILCPVLARRVGSGRRGRGYSRDKRVPNYRSIECEGSSEGGPGGLGQHKHLRIVMKQREAVKRSSSRHRHGEGDGHEHSVVYCSLLRTCHLYLITSDPIWQSRLQTLLKEQREASASPSLCQKPLLLLINPNSGKGNAVKLFNQMVKPMLNLAHISFEHIVTKKANHARNIMVNLDLNRFGAIVIISGDGLLYEVYEGLSSRCDWSTSHLKPVAVIPSGSGNGLCRSLLNERRDFYNEHQAVICSTLALVSGRVKCMDMMRVETRSGKILHAFLSIAWGFMSDCDIGSERLRFLGELRFTLWGIYRLLAYPGYRVKLAYCPMSKDAKLSFKDGYLPKFAEAVPDHWVTLEDELAEFYVVSTSFISGKINLAPEARIDDGLMWMIMVRRNIVGRKAFLKFLADTEKGTHGSLEGVELIPITAFRLEPLNTDVGHMTVDGEEIKSEAIQACILPSFARVIV